MIRRFICPDCEGGKVQCSRYGGNDPEVWWSKDACEECDGDGNIDIDDEGRVIGEIVTQHDCHWYMRQGGRASRAWSAMADGAIGYGSSEVRAVRGLLEELADQADEREYERSSSKEEIGA